MKLNLVPESDLTRPETENIKLRLARVEAKEISTVTLGAIANTLLTAKGDLIVASAASTPARYGVVAPAAGLLNVLAVANAEDTPTYKAIFDTTAASAVSLSAGTAGTQLVAARRDHTHLVTASSAGAADAHVMATDASGYTSAVRLGAGIAPAIPLHVAHATDPTIRQEATGTYAQKWDFIVNYIGTDRKFVLYDRTNSRAVITADNTNGFVGVGTTSPGALFTVNNGSLQITGARVAPTSGIGLEMGYGGVSGDILAYDRAGGAVYKPLNLNDTIYVTGGSGGNVGIRKTSSIGSALAVVGLVDYANNAAAVTGGLSAGDFYTETGTNPKRVCVVY